MLKTINKQPRTITCSNTNLDETRYVNLKWYVPLYPECRPYYRPFGIGYGIYVRVSIRYTTKGNTYPAHPTITSYANPQYSANKFQTTYQTNYSS